MHIAVFFPAFAPQKSLLGALSSIRDDSILRCRLRPWDLRNFPSLHVFHHQSLGSNCHLGFVAQIVFHLETLRSLLDIRYIAVSPPTGTRKTETGTQTPPLLPSVWIAAVSLTQGQISSVQCSCFAGTGLPRTKVGVCPGVDSKRDFRPFFARTRRPDLVRA